MTTNNSYRETARNRRAFFGDVGMGFASLALGAMLHRDGIVRGASPDLSIRQPTPARAKNVIWIFLAGGVSHIEGFDPKPILKKYDGMTIEETPYKAVLTSPLNNNLRIHVPNDANGQPRSRIFAPQVGSRKRGQSGIEVSDWWPEVGACVDDMTLIRSVWTTDNNHGAQLQFHTGRHILEGQLPTIGSWIHYGLGSLNDDQPSYVVLGTPIGDCCGGVGAHGAGYLGPEHDGVRLDIDPAKALPYSSPVQGVFREEQREEFALIDQLNRVSAEKYPDDAALKARIKSYELAFRMQTAVPEVVRLETESAETERLYGIDIEHSRDFGRQCLAARRLVERGVRFVQLFHGAGGPGAWDSHENLRDNHSRLCKQVDRPIAGLLKDLKRRGLLDDSLVVWASEFGRTPGAQNGGGRDHHALGFPVWMAGGGVKRGVVHGSTDEIGFHAVVDRHYVTDIHATVLRQLGLDSRNMEIVGHKRLEMDFGKPIDSIIA